MSGLCGWAINYCHEVGRLRGAGYFIEKRYSQKFQWHLHVLDVPNRSFILFHPANNAQRELNGCIAPVTKLSGPGLGLLSRKAFTKLKDQVYKALAGGESVLLIVQST